MEMEFHLDVHHWSVRDVMSSSVDILWEAGLPNRNRLQSPMVSTQSNGFQHMKGREVSAVDPLADRSGGSARQRLETKTVIRHQK